ncbi:MAG: hypothetical protein AB2L24_29990 [Mangrovibacterium sp.]
MKREVVSVIFFTLVIGWNLNIYGQPDKFPILTESDFGFLEEMTKDVLESSRIYPGQTITSGPLPNNTGGILIRPGGRDCYPLILDPGLCHVAGLWLYPG